MILSEQFTQVVTALSPTLYRLCISILHSEQDAQDAVQQGLMKAWAKKDSVRPDTFRAFLTRIIINECRNIQRHRQRMIPVEQIGPAGETFISDDFDLKTAIDGLPEKLRTPLLMYYMENYLEREIAQALHISLMAVKNRLFRARKSLKTALHDEEAGAKCQS